MNEVEITESSYIFVTFYVFNMGGKHRGFLDVFIHHCISKILCNNNSLEIKLFHCLYMEIVLKHPFTRRSLVFFSTEIEVILTIHKLVFRDEYDEEKM